MSRSYACLPPRRIRDWPRQLLSHVANPFGTSGRSLGLLVLPIPHIGRQSGERPEPLIGMLDRKRSPVALPHSLADIAALEPQPSGKVLPAAMYHRLALYHFGTPRSKRLSTWSICDWCWLFAGAALPFRHHFHYNYVF